MTELEQLRADLAVQTELLAQSHEREKALRAEVVALTKENDRLNERRAEAEKALRTIRDNFQTTINLYDANGPEWTSRANGEEYYGAAYVLGTADETIAIIDAVLSHTTPNEASG